MFVPLISHHLHVILGSIYIQFELIFCLIVYIQVQPKLSWLFVMFLVIVMSSYFLSRFVLSSFGFQIFGCNPTFGLFSLFVQIVSHHCELSKLIRMFLWFLIIRTPSYKFVSGYALFRTSSFLELFSSILFLKSV